MISGRMESGVSHNATGIATGRRALRRTSKRCSVSKRHKCNDFVKIIVTSFIYKNVDHRKSDYILIPKERIISRVDTTV